MASRTGGALPHPTRAPQASAPPAARRPAAIPAPAPHAADTRNADAADTRNADAAAAPPAAGISAATSGVSAAGVSAATRVSAAIARVPCPGGVLRLDRFSPRRFGDQAVDFLAAPIGGRLLVPKIPCGGVERQPGGHSRAGQQEYLP